MKFDFRHEYEWELEYKEALRSAVATPVGILTGIGTLIGFMVLRFQFCDDYYSRFFIVLAAFAALSLAVAVYALSRTSHGNIYKRVEYTSGLKAYYAQLEQWHRRTLASTKEDVDRDFKEYLDDSYAKAAEHNAKVNEERADYLFVANRFLLAAAVFTALAFVPFFINFETQPQKPQTVLIANLASSLQVQRGSDHVRHTQTTGSSAPGTISAACESSKAIGSAAARCSGRAHSPKEVR